MRPDHLTYFDLFFHPFSFGPLGPESCTRVTARICIGNETFRECSLPISLLIQELDRKRPAVSESSDPPDASSNVRDFSLRKMSRHG